MNFLFVTISYLPWVYVKLFNILFTIINFIIKINYYDQIISFIPFFFIINNTLIKFLILILLWFSFFLFPSLKNEVVSWKVKQTCPWEGKEERSKDILDISNSATPQWYKDNVGLAYIENGRNIILKFMVKKIYELVMNNYGT